MDATPCSRVDDLDIFTSTDKHDIAAAKAVCATCPATVKTACLQVALDLGEQGIWAGTTKTQRLRIGANTQANAKTGRRRPLKPITHGTPQGYSLHRNRGEAACDACKKAAAERSATDRATKRQQQHATARLNQEGTAA